MRAYLIPIQTAILLFPLLAACLTLPYVLHQYRKFGSIMMLRVAIVYSFVFYLLCAYFLVLLPLPPIEEVAQYTKAIMQLMPFSFVQDFQQAWHGSLLAFLKTPAFYQVGFNFLLLFPLGVYLSYYFQWSLSKVILSSFIVSLSFECLQLSGLLGIYPRPYRLFDVDDLIINTLGGCLGCLCAPLFAFFLPSRETLDLNSYHRGTNVSAGRRLFALIVDQICLWSGMWLLDCLFSLTNIPYQPFHAIIAFLLSFLLLDLLVPCFWHGQTLGKHLVKIKLQEQDHPLRVLPCLFHFFLRDITFLGAPFWIYQIIQHIFHHATAPYLFLSFLVFLYMIYFFILLLQSIHALYQVSYIPLYNRFWHIHNISTIHVPENKDTSPKKEIS